MRWRTRNQQPRRICHRTGRTVSSTLGFDTAISTEAETASRETSTTLETAVLESGMETALWGMASPSAVTGMDRMHGASGGLRVRSCIRMVGIDRADLVPLVVHFPQPPMRTPSVAWRAARRLGTLSTRLVRPSHDEERALRSPLVSSHTGLLIRYLSFQSVGMHAQFLIDMPSQTPT